MNCPKCGSTGLYRDDDRLNGIPIIACIICGLRIYKGTQQRLGGKENKEEGRAERQKDIEEQKNQLQDILSQKERQKRRCEKCGKAFMTYGRAKYCLICRVIVKREHRRKYDREYRKRNLKKGDINGSHSIHASNQ